MMLTLKQIFINPDEKRLRSGWRVAYYLVLFVGVYFVAGLLSATFSLVLDLNPQIELLISSVLLAIGFTLITWLARDRIDQRSFSSLGLERSKTSWRELGLGLALGAVLMGLIFIVQLLAGWLVVEGNAFEIGAGAAVSSLFTPLILFILVGYYEELVFRGYILQNLMEGAGLVWGLIISSILFGGLHLVNPNPTWFSLAGITGAGLLMAYAWIKTKRLWLPIGLHIAWNFFEGAVFGFPVSGITIDSLLKIRDSGPAWMTGAEFGPEGGLIVLPAMALGAAAIWWYGRRKSLQ
jgi:membrane protease YdiL (CAAX protease family)